MADAKITIPLDLPNVSVLAVEVSERGYTISVESTLKGTRCRRCGRKIQAFHGYNDWIEVRHLPILDRAVYLRYRPKRYECPHCAGQPTTTQAVTWHTPGSGMTKVYEAHVLKALIHSTIEDVSVKESLSYDQVLGVMERCVAAQVDWTAFQRLEVLGIDEIAVKKGQRDYAVIISAQLANGDLAVLGVLPDRQQATVQAFLDNIPARLKATLHSVCVDMYEPYRLAVEAALPQADVVIDRFHVAKHYMDAADALRKKTMKDLKKTLPTAEYATLKGVHLVFRRHWAALSAPDRLLLERLFGYAPVLRLVYAFREGLFRIFETAPSVAQAAEDLKAWMFLVREQHLPGFDAFLQTLQAHWEGILNFFKHRLTSGFVEGLNTKIRVLTRRCFGLFNLQHFFQRLWLDVEGYRVLA
jgi:transposase